MRSTGRTAAKLPADTTSFVGRRREIADVRKLLAGSRLVTLGGVGGVGKTRLAIEVARRVRGTFAHGLLLADLAPVANGSEIAQTIGNTIAVVDRSTKAPAEKLVNYIGPRSLLLVLDNCEHLVEDCARLADELLRAAPRLRILATSRRPLDVAGEQLYEVLPLSVPDPEQLSGPESVGRYDAVRLLVERATARDPHFALTADNCRAAAQLCAQLDGIPLAIELAATRLRTLSIEMLVERLGDRFSVLTEGSRAALPRQRTLRALIDWSYGLCTSREQQLWASLSVFSGGFDLEAVEGVCVDEGLGRWEIVDALDGLVAQSVVSAEHRSTGKRYRLLETIREYGQERLAESGHGSALRRRHRDFYLRRAKLTAEAWCGPDQEHGLARLREDHGNLRTAFELFLAEDNDVGSALELATALLHHWHADVFLGEGRQWLDRALALPGPPRERAGALWVAAWVSLLQGDRDAASDRLAECEALAGSIGDTISAAYATSLQGTASLFSGDLVTAVERYERGIAALRASGETGGELAASFQLATALAHSGETARAIAVCEAAVATCTDHGEHWARSMALWTWGSACWLGGDPGSAADLTRKAMSIQQRFGDPVAAGLMIELLAWAACSERDYAASARLLGLAGWIWQRVGTSVSAIGPHHAAHHDRCVAEVAEAVGADPLAHATPLADGLTVAQVIGLALAPETAVGPPRDEQLTELTRREREVAYLIADGLTNREIANVLVISPRTVDGHVERILAKLSVRSRVQVASWVNETRATVPTPSNT